MDPFITILEAIKNKQEFSGEDFYAVLLPLTSSGQDFNSKLAFDCIRSQEDNFTPAEERKVISIISLGRSHAPGNQKSFEELETLIIKYKAAEIRRPSVLTVEFNTTPTLITFMTQLSRFVNEKQTPPPRKHFIPALDRVIGEVLYDEYIEILNLCHKGKETTGFTHYAAIGAHLLREFSKLHGK